MLRIDVVNRNSGIPEYSHSKEAKTTLTNVLKELEEVLSEIGMTEIRNNYEIHIKFK